MTLSSRPLLTASCHSPRQEHTGGGLRPRPEVEAGAAFRISSSFTRSGQLGAKAVRHAIPAICPYRDFAAAGGLMSYGTNTANQLRQVGVYTSRILKGEKPADLPVQQAVKLDLIINLKTARALGLEVPMSMLMRVDEVIE